MKESYQFGITVPEGKEMEDVSELGLILRKPKCAPAEWVTRRFELTFAIERAELADIATAFVEICEKLDRRHLYTTAGISFKFVFSSWEDTRGLHLPASFLARISRWEPIIDISITSL